MLTLIHEINILWEPVYPYLARHIEEVYGRTDGVVAEIGPFCGVIYTLANRHVGDSFYIYSFPEGMEKFYREEVQKRNMAKTIGITATTSSLTDVPDATVDLLVFRGALFFPSLFRVDYAAIRRVLKPGGVAFVGGGFGKHTPAEVIRSIGEESRELNLRIGKTEVSPDKIRENLKKDNIQGEIDIITEGGLWTIIRSYPPARGSM